MKRNAPPQLYVISGAGLSAESGLPTYRDQGGIWSKYDMNKVCNALTWKDNREMVFSFYREMADAYQHVLPHAGHRAIAEWQRDWPGQVHVLTQNVDHLLEDAGVQDVIHLHGDLFKLHCTACGNKWNHEADVLTRCPKCNSLKGVKPGVIFFHEFPPEYVHLSRLQKNMRHCDMVIFVGTAFEVIPAEKMIPLKLWGSTNVISVNPVTLENTVVLGRQIEAPASQGLPALTALVATVLSPTGGL